jgi:hypothetical protein
VGFVPGEPAHINNLGPFSIAQNARSARNLSIGYKTGTVGADGDPTKRKDADGVSNHETREDCQCNRARELAPRYRHACVRQREKGHDGESHPWVQRQLQPFHGRERLTSRNFGDLQRASVGRDATASMPGRMRDHLIRAEMLGATRSRVNSHEQISEARIHRVQRQPEDA